MKAVLIRLLLERYDINSYLHELFEPNNVSITLQDAPILDQLLSTNPHNLWLSTDGAGVVNFGPFCKLATSSRIPVNLFVQVNARYVEIFGIINAD